MRIVAVAGPSCPDCGVRPGVRHMYGCDVPRCVVDGEQHLQHVLFAFEEDDLTICTDACAPEIWSGIWPGVMEARERGWYSILVEGQGWVPVPPGTPEASEDLNRVHTDLVWDPVQLKRVDPPLV